MVISQADAASALRDVDQTTRRSAELRAYTRTSPYLILWGLIWIAGYVGMGLLPERQWGMLWLPLDLVGFVGSAAIGLRSRRTIAGGSGEEERSKTLSILAIMLFIGLFVASVYIVFRPTTQDPYLVFPSMLVGLVYVVAGAWKMPRLAWVGAAVFVLTMIGFFAMKPFLSFWIAAVGGGGLVLGGLWLRKA